MAAADESHVPRSRRLILRTWRREDLEPFAALNADPVVMEHFPAPLSRVESDACADRLIAHIAAHGFGFWALEVRATGRFIGFTGLQRVRLGLQLDGTVEIGWRLARSHWGQGLATEAAQAAVRYGAEALGLHEIVAFTTPGNRRSRAVMERIPMHRDPDADFEHPALPAGHPLRPHIVYRTPLLRPR